MTRLGTAGGFGSWLRLCAGIAVCACLCACKPGVPGHVLSEAVMEDVLFDYHLAQGMAELGDSMEQRRYLYVQAVFRKHGITEAQFDSSMVWYLANASYLNDIYQRLGARFDAESRVMGIGTGPVDMYAGLTSSGDTANIWAERDFYLLKPNEGVNRMTFVMEADTTFYPGDTFLWRFTPRFVYQEGEREAYAALMVRLSNDSVVSAQQRLGSNYRVELPVHPVGEWEVKEVSGFVYVPAANAPAAYRMLVIDKPALIRFHKEKTAAADTLAVADSLRQDSLQELLSGDLLPVHPQVDRRITPRELREVTQPEERTIHVVKSKPYRTVPNQSGQRRRRR